MADSMHPELDQLRRENARLIGLLEAHGIAWRSGGPAPTEPAPISQAAPANGPSSTREKVALFRRLFRGRDDVHALRWQSNSSGRSGYGPACANEWKPGICEKPRVACRDCSHRELLPLSDAAIYGHLAGDHTIGLYPLLENDHCHLLAVDFDEQDWRDDARAFLGSCRQLGVPAALEISRSGEGAHVWVFFEEAVPAREARQLGAALISHTCAASYQLQLSSYDRLFPNQDSMPKGGFGNLIALPLQKEARQRGCSVFVNDDLHPYPDQWAYLATLQRLPVAGLQTLIQSATCGAHPLDLAFIDEEDMATPWKAAVPLSRLRGPLPTSLTLTLADRLYVERLGLPQPLLNRLIRLAAFANPAFFKAQAMRLSVWDKPRVIGCAENFPQHIALPRGCLEPVQTLLQEQGISWELVDERQNGSPLEMAFTGQLRADQEAAVEAMLRHDIGVLQAPTAFGKTVVAAAILARRGVNTLVLVHRADLLRQWQERLHTFLDVAPEAIGCIGGGKAKPTGQLDIAVMQSLVRKGEVNPLVQSYGQVIVDECHHIAAASFEAILRQVKARYVLGLSATLVRRDGLQPILFMQCGPIRHTAQRPAGAPQTLELVSRTHQLEGLPTDLPIQELMRRLAEDPRRTERIVEEALACWGDGHRLLLLSERTDHITTIAAALADRVANLFLLHGRLSARQRSATLAALEALPPDAPRIVLATGRLVGEGFDHPPLNTLLLAMPVSWQGTLQQYAGRLHRQQAGKTSVRIIDWLDLGHPVPQRMWERRLRGYRAMGYALRADQLSMAITSSKASHGPSHIQA
ncbi:DEAD/DEAH box helicase family protein [Synechococcus sp. CBW1006]|jgi:superfamily II DNA or RNA helicase|uniref:TOTE conflict system archaeo-eukaryotic primase domain-containing protein n=1 Tax=Synechococcus sp. CBW1006 TaxID=1353138 RepID=UPI001937EC6B|nr:DEAD/DEAH box helicase [Synechococcus sp. CBW1006]QPN67272.1 DEAD/DEAH box helicase family protein [Synechococcus sp. CBW1006]